MSSTRTMAWLSNAGAKTSVAGGCGKPSTTSGGDICHVLHERALIQRGGNADANLAQLPGDGRLLFRVRQQSCPLGDVSRNLRRRNDHAVVVIDRRHRQ